MHGVLEKIRVNHILDFESVMEGSGIYSSAVRIVRALRKTGMKCDLNGSGKYDILHFHTALPQSVIRVHKLHSRPESERPILVTHGHTTIEDFRNSYLFSNNISMFALPYLKTFYNSVDAVIAVSPYNAEILRAYGVDPNSISVISNGIDISRLRKDRKLRTRARDALSLGDDGVLVIGVGISIYRKGIDCFTKVAELLPQIQFKWIGLVLTPGLLAQTRTLKQTFAKARSLSNMQFTGYVSGFTIKALFNSADIFLYPTRVENQGIALLEAGSYGLPAVVRDIPVFDWLTDGKECIKGESINEFANAVEYLSRNPNVRESMANSALEHLESHSMDKTIEKITDLYSNLASKF